jgi:predicted O-linked N-acetylglucosamine transferase (SPINDLY family)
MDNLEEAKQFFLAGLSCLESKNYGEAELNFEKSLKISPNRVSVLTNLSAVKIKLKKINAAKEFALRSIALDPMNGPGYLNMGLANKEEKDFDSALTYFDKAITAEPKLVEAWCNKGSILNELKRHEEALTYFDKAIELDPNNAEAFNNKGFALNELKRYEDALKYFDKAIELDPNNAEAWCNKGASLVHQNQTKEALVNFNRAIEIEPGFDKAWSNKGAALIEIGKTNEALDCLENAISLKPQNVHALNNKGICLNKLKRYEDSISTLKQVFELNPDYEFLLGNLLESKLQICQWDSYLQDRDLIFSNVKGGSKVVLPFPLLTISASEDMNLQGAKIWANLKYPENFELGPIAKGRNNSKIRLGYFSPDFLNHPVAALTVELFELHNREKFELFGFSLRPSDGSPIRRRLDTAFDRIIEVQNMSDKSVAQLSRELEIDIAIDLCGFTAGSRTGIFAHRAAPIQVSYIGYLGSMGTHYMDYLIADSTIIPANSKHFYSEKIIYLPSYQANDRKREISKKKFTRASLGLPEEGFIFCCFNNNYKFNPIIFDSWMRILNAVDTSVLFLYADNLLAKENLQKEAILRGVNPKRIIFGERIPAPDYLARYRVCDLFLDTLPYNAGTTASDALWAGLPVLTQIGQSFPGRVAASLLNAIGLPELITHTQDEYENLAVELATNPKKINDIKAKLERNRLTTALFNSPLFTEKLEAAYKKMHERYLNQSSLEHVYIF